MGAGRIPRFRHIKHWSLAGWQHTAQLLDAGEAVSSCMVPSPVALYPHSAELLLWVAWLCVCFFIYKSYVLLLSKMPTLAVVLSCAIQPPALIIAGAPKRHDL